MCRASSASQLMSFWVECSETICGELLKVVGSAPELGAWSPEASTIVLSTNPEDFPLWRSEWISLPAGGLPCDYKFVICTAGGGQRWEPGANRKLPSRGTLQAAGEKVAIREAFGRPEPAQLAPQAACQAAAPPPSVARGGGRCRASEQPLRRDDTATHLTETPSSGGSGGHELSFAVRCSETKPGQHVRVVGSLQVLGEWVAAASSAVLQTRPADFPVWRSQVLHVALGEQLTFEYKYVICDESGSCIWESGPNRSLDVEGSGQGCKRVTVEGAWELTPQLLHVNQLIVREMPRRESADADAGEGGARPFLLTLPQRTVPPLPKLPVAVQNIGELPPTPSACSGRRRQGMQRAMSEGSLPPDTDRTHRASMRRVATHACIAEMPEGLLPTRRALQQPYSSNGELIREAARGDIFGSEQATPRPIDHMDVDSPDIISGLFVAKPQRPDAKSGADCCDGSSTDTGVTTDASDGSPDDCSVQTADEADRPVEPGPEPGPACESAGVDVCYEMGQQIGEGSFGKVFACTRRRDGLQLAAKVVRIGGLSTFSLCQLLGNPSTGQEGEASLHLSLPAHPNLVRLHDFFREPKTVSLVMDLCSGGDLFDAIAQVKKTSRSRGTNLALSEDAACNVVRQILSGVAFCHQNGVVHRDVKAENVLIRHPPKEVPLEHPDAVLQLCDFGLATRCRPEDGAVLEHPAGSPDYVAPEVARMEAYGCNVDVWSCGVLLFASLRGRLPFEGKTDKEVLLSVQSGSPIFDEAWSSVGDGARGCVDHLMEPCPELRPSAADALAYSWLNARA